MSPASTNGTCSRAFGKDARLRFKSQLDNVREAGVSYAARTCVVNVLKTPPDGMKRAAFSVSKRYSLLAVDRNRARRLFRECYRQLHPLLPPSWVIFIPRHRMKNAMLDEVLRDVKYSLDRLGIPLATVPSPDNG